MNTGIQRSSATPLGAWTTTTPAGSIKGEAKKDIEKIMLAHGVPYLATLSVAYPDDAVRKFQKARTITGTKFFHLLSPCPPGWRIDPANSIRATRMATLAKVFPLYEVENGKVGISVQPQRDITVKEYVEAQGRFRQITDEMVDILQQNVDKKWDELVQQDGKTVS